jgi:hypothetical protein
MSDPTQRADLDPDLLDPSPDFSFLALLCPPFWLGYHRLHRSAALALAALPGGWVRNQAPQKRSIGQPCPSGLIARGSSSPESPRYPASHRRPGPSSTLFSAL